MTEPAAWVLVALAAVLVGAAVPVLVQLRKTLKVAEETLQSTSLRVNEALDQLTATLERVNRAAEGIEHGLSRVSGLLEALSTAGAALSRVRSSVGSIASIGSAVLGALLAAFGWTSHGRGDGPRQADPVADEETRHE